jgi:hypothetical protein
LRVRGSDDNRSKWITWSYCVLLAIVLLAPFDFYHPIQRTPNGVAWLEGTRGIELSSGGIVRTVSPAKKLQRTLVGSPGFSIEAWVAPTDLDQGGPARILTYSLDKSLRNFTIGQNRDTLVFRLRTTRTGPNGARPQTVVDGVFSTTDPTHLVVTYDHVAIRIYVDGRLESSVPTAGGRLDNWSDRYQFALGNELTGNRPWSGRIYHVAIYRRALSAMEIEMERSLGSSLPIGKGCVALFAFDEKSGNVIHDRSGEPDSLELAIPEHLEISNEPFLHPPYRYVDFAAVELGELTEIVANMALFIPFGFLCVYASRSRATVSAAIAIVLMGVFLSLGAEVVQYFIRGRESSLGDVLHNGIGAAIGVALARRAYFFSRTPEIRPR